MNCVFCGHPEEAHCKGGVKHVSRKNDGGNAVGVTVTCQTRHCENPLCCCVEFVEPVIGAAA
jgi:hypothetical protein